MSEEIPVYPRQPFLNIGSVPLGPPTQGFPENVNERKVLELTEEEVTELGWDTPMDAGAFVQEQWATDYIPKGYQYYYWYIDIPLEESAEAFQTGIISNFFNAGGEQTNKLILGAEDGDITIRMWFIFHPAQESSTNNWYIACSNKDETGKMFARLQSYDGHSTYYISRHDSDIASSRYSETFFIPWTECYNGTLTPDDLTVYASNNNPLV